MKALPLFLSLLGGAYGADAVSTTACKIGDFCVSERNFDQSKSVYTTSDHQNAQLNIHNPSNPGNVVNMFLQAYGKDADNRINVSGDIYLNIPKATSDADRKSELSIDMKNANYTGNINLIKDPTYLYNYITSPDLKIKLSYVNFNGNINVTDYKLAEDQEAIRIDHTTLNGNLYAKTLSTQSMNFTNSTFNGNVTWVYDMAANGNNPLTSQFFGFNGNTFNNSKITLGLVNPNYKFTGNSWRFIYYSTIVNNTFNNTTLNFTFPTPGLITFKNNTFNGGSINLNNTVLSSLDSTGLGYFNSQGSHIRANINIIGDGTQIIYVPDGTYTEETDPDPKYEKHRSPIFEDQKPINCKDGSPGCYTPHDPTKPENPLYDSNGNPIYNEEMVYVPGKKYTSSTRQLGMNFTFEGLAATDKDNASGVYQHSYFEGNISLSGGNNNFVVKDKSIMKKGTLFIAGGKNTFAVSDGTSFDHFNIEISRLLKRRSQINDDDLANWKNCDSPGSLCYQDPSNTFDITDSNFTNSSFTIIGGTENKFNFVNSSFSDGDITILGGLVNTLNFKDTPKIGGEILISGGTTNTVTFTNTILSETTKKFIVPSSAASLTSSSSNPFDPATMTPLKAAIITGKMTPTFIKTLNSIAPDLFAGDLVLGSSSLSDTNSSITFLNGTVMGDILIENGNAQNIKKVDSVISMTSNLFLGDIKSNGNGMITKTTLKDSGMVGDIQTNQGINYTIIDSSQLYGDITTLGGTNIASIKNGSVFAGSMSTYDGKNFVDLNMSLYTNPYGGISRINTYGGESNITLSINSTIAAVLTSQKIYPVFHIANYNGGIANIAVEGPVSGTAQVDYSGGTANIIFADSFDNSITNKFFADGASCATAINDECIKSGQAIIDPINQKFKINGYTFQDGLAIKLDADKADKILKPFRDVYKNNYASIFLDKSGISADGTKDNVYRMKINGIIVGAEYNLPSSSDMRYEVTFGRNSAFIGQMFAKTDNTNFILSEGSKFILDGGSNSVISKLSSEENLNTDLDTMFDATLAQKNNVIIDLATSGYQVTRAFKKDTFSMMHILEMDNFNNAVFRVGIDASKTDGTNNINTIPSNTDRIIISDIATGQHLSDYLQVYQDYNHLITGDLSNKNILVAVVENSPKPDTSMIFDTSASNVQQGYDQVKTILTTKPVKVDRKVGKDGAVTGTGAIDINPDPKDANAMGYFIQSATTQVDPRNLANTNNAITSNYAIFLANINNLNKRMGELRDNSYAQGAWSRIFSGLNSSTRGDESKIYSNNIQVGYDYGYNTDVGEQFLGAAFTYGYDTIKGNAYNGSANVFEFAGYYSWVGNEGLYTDTILKYTYIRNKISLKDNLYYNTPLNSNGGSIGQELGYRYYADKDKTFYIEPSGEFILGIMNGGVINQVSQSGLIENNDFIATLQADLNYVFNFRGKVGANFGYRLKTDKNQTDFRIGAFYVADVVNGGVINYKTNYSSAQTLLQPNQQMMINLGVNSIVSENWRVYADLDSGFLGAYFNQNYLVSVGLRYEFGHALNPLAAKLAEEKRIANIKLYTQRLDESIARTKLKQDRIRESEIFEKQKADILATSKAKQEANIVIRKKERDLDATKFKTLSLAIAKVINEALPDSELQKFQSQELKVLEDAKQRVTKNIQADAELNRKENEAQHLKATKDLQKRQPEELKDLEDKQAKNKKDMLDRQVQSKQAYLEKQAKEKQDLIASQAEDIKKAKPADKTKLEAKQAKDLKDLENKQAKDIKLFTDRMAKDVKILEDKQAKAILEMKNKQLQEAQDLKDRQTKQNKIVEEYIDNEEKESSMYLKKISDDLETRQIKAKKDLQKAQKNALSLQIKKAIDNGISDNEFQKLQAEEFKHLEANKVSTTQDIKARAIKNTKELKESQVQEAKGFDEKQSVHMKEFADKVAKEKQDLITSQAEDIKKAKPADKTKLEAKQAKDLKDLENKQAKELVNFKAKVAKEKKDMLDKQAKETKNLEANIAKEEKENESYWKKATMELEAKQNKDKKALQEVHQKPQLKTKKVKQEAKKPEEPANVQPEKPVKKVVNKKKK